MTCEKRDPIEFVVQCVDNYTVEGYAYTESLTLIEASILGCASSRDDETHTVQLSGEYSVVSTDSGPKVCIDSVSLCYMGTVLTLGPANLDMQLLIDDIECAGEYQQWIQDLADNSDELYDSHREREADKRDRSDK